MRLRVRAGHPGRGWASHTSPDQQEPFGEGTDSVLLSWECQKVPDAGAQPSFSHCLGLWFPKPVPRCRCSACADGAPVRGAVSSRALAQALAAHTPSGAAAAGAKTKCTTAQSHLLPLTSPESVMPPGALTLGTLGGKGGVRWPPLTVPGEGRDCPG